MLVPEVRIAIAHGQIVKRFLERTMMASWTWYDLLLCSTIESGLDIPSVNTHIVYDADYSVCPALSAAGQGRTINRVAYAYFTYVDKVLNRVQKS